MDLIKRALLQWLASREGVSFSRACTATSIMERTQLFNFNHWLWTQSPLSTDRTSHFSSESESEVTQLCPTLCDPIDCSLSGSSVHGIFQAVVLEWIAISFSRGSSQPRARTQVSRIVDRLSHYLVFRWLTWAWPVASQSLSLLICQMAIILMTNIS